MMQLRWLLYVSLVLVVSCAAEDDVGVLTEESAGLNGIAMNGLVHNALADNKPVLNALAASGMTAAAATTGLQTALNDPLARKVLTYLVECALPPGDTASFSSADGTWSATAIQGRFGFAPEWKTGTCDGQCKRWVSGCLYARINAYNTKVTISVRAPAGIDPGISPTLTAIPAAEKTAYPLMESGFYGNYWNWSAVAPLPEIHACAAGTGTAASAIAALKLRICGGSLYSCDGIVVGSCGATSTCAAASKACASVEPTSGAIQSCATDDDYCLGGDPVFTEVVTVYRAPACPHYDYQTGVAMPAACSPCANRLALVAPSCNSGTWSSSCQTLSRTVCPDHNLFTVGAALQRGSSDAVTAVCSTKPSCCDATWDASCVAAAKTYYPTVTPGTDPSL